MNRSRRELLKNSLTIAGALVFTSVSRSALAGDLEDALAEVKVARASMKTMKGPFSQERTIGLLSAKVKSTGTLTMVRPDRLRWELAPPDDIVYWVGPEGFSYKSPRGQGHVPGAAARLASAMEDVRLVLGGDLDQLRTRYDLTLVSKTPEEVSFMAMPKAASGDLHLQKILFSLGKDRAMPTRATLVEAAKDKTDIVFGTMQRDIAIDPAFIRPNF
ncbi:MAG: outer membrane lipoprotein carrier protein LolA [Polyangiaceae bacterium]